MRNGYPITKAKVEFTDYTVASTKHGQINVILMRINYKHDREMITLRRAARLDSRFWDTRLKPHPVKVRCGYPTKRERDEDIPSKRGVPHSNFLKRFKIVDRVTCVAGNLVYTCKIWVLHATRGWKVYA